MPYALLWGERMVRSVANLTRQDAKDFLELAARTRLEMHVECLLSRRPTSRWSD
jgi:propanol-preferring alcohol dehydrogenase